MKIGMPFFLFFLVTTSARAAKSQVLYLSGRVPASISLVEVDTKKKSKDGFTLKSNVHPTKYEVNKQVTGRLQYIEIISR
ncbi:MAG: hypothetical protein CME65_03770 [Halobacteriovoraceae bacterium]|nr:hypothetical protein [Halobacteriovoraceae bacterium]|tara:strand:- start:2126 stop:2365 length:240 start_codon:yes stop_codon:yes gene_type:complete